MKKTGVLLLNLGTPDAPEPEAVGRYLKEFLMDKWVIDIPAPLRWFLVNVLIVPKRKFASAEAYKKIWTHEGSPLLTNLKKLAEQVAPRLGGAPVAVGMRYGDPSIASAFQKLKTCDRILVFPLYPQYAESSVRSSEEKCQAVAKEVGFSGEVQFVPPFFDEAGFIAAFAQLVQESQKSFSADHLLMSFHGLPEHHVKRTDPTGQHCLANSSCCDKMVDANRLCYRAQSFATARALAKKLGITNYSVSFQSRLGRRPWIKPYSDELYKSLPQNGVKRLLVVSPSFAADCLETLEEIEMRGREDFLAAGGEDFKMVPCLNFHPLWVEAVVDTCQRYLV